MAYLFGDLTPAPFTTNFLEELRDAVEFAAALADADQCIASADVRRESLRRKAHEEAARIETLVHAIGTAIERADKGANDSPSTALANELSRLIGERRSSYEVAIEKHLGEQFRALENELLEARADYFPMLERYLLARVPPTTKETLSIELVGTKRDERRYVAEVGGRSDLGLGWTIEVAIPSKGPWSEPLRVDDVVVDLAVTAPQVTGLIKKEVKPKKTKLGRHFVTKLTDDGKSIRIELRDEIGKPDGFDLTVDLVRNVLLVTKTGEEDDETAGTFDPMEEDQAPLFELARQLRATTRTLAKKRLASATFDGMPFDGENTDAQPKLVQLVSRLADRLAPSVEEVARRSRSEDELVLRRVLDDGKREEMFMPKSRLREKLEGLDGEHRDLFVAIESALDAAEATETTIDVDALPPHETRSEVPPAVAPYVRRDSSKQMPAVKVEIPQPKPPPRLELQADSIPDPSEIEPVPSSSRTGELKAMLKTARSLSKEGRHDASFRAYASLFASSAFQASKPEDQRAVLKMMIHAKLPTSAASTADAMAAHRAALPALQALVVTQRDPADYEMLGMVYVALDEPAKATEIFKKALEIERARSPGSDLCGDLMRRVSQL